MASESSSVHVLALVVNDYGATLQLSVGEVAEVTLYVTTPDHAAHEFLMPPADFVRFVNAAMCVIRPLGEGGGR